MRAPLSAPSPSVLSFVAATLLVAAGCFSPNIQDGQLACGANRSCPGGFTCFPDGRCHRDGTTPDCSPACSGVTPVCDRGTLRCVGCLADGDCPPGFLCNAMMKSCRQGCSAAHAACAPDAGSCDVDAGYCRGCNGDAECTDAAAPRCDKDSGRCVACLPQNDNCPADQRCDGANGNFSCVAGCKVSADCNPAATDDGGTPDGGGPPQRECCEHKCVDTKADTAHCGTCGHACQGGNACCAGACSDLASDLANCGACGQACMLQNVMGPVCMSSMCGYGKCNSGFSDCDLKPENGCEINIGTNQKHCGMCGNECGPYANAVPGCSTGSCTIAACNTGFEDCDKSVKSGCEVDLNNDTKNCGLCGTVCPNVINGQPGCRVGKCGVGSCNATFRDCNAALVDGCEANLLTDPKNCGGCGTACAFTNATPLCQGGGCVLGPCNAGFGNCDNNPMNGCETNVNTDVNNCGACAAKCVLPNATPGCAAGRCTVVSCTMGFGNCDGNPVNGCEAVFANDNNNCGACGRACPMGQTCMNGVCGGIAQVCMPPCINGGVCIANNMCQTPPHAPGTFGPMHTFVNVMSDFYISTGQGSCSVGNMQNAAIDAQYFCQHFYGPNCNVKMGYTQVSRAGNKMHKNSGCTSAGSDIPGTVCDQPNAPGQACKMWIMDAEVDAGLTGLICVCS